MGSFKDIFGKVRNPGEICCMYFVVVQTFLFSAQKTCPMFTIVPDNLGAAIPSVTIYTTVVVYGGMTSTSSIKISETVKEVLSCRKVHPRETYSDVIERLVRQTQDGVPPGHIPLQYVKIKGAIRELDNPIDLSVEVEDGEYIIYNNEYHLLVVAPDLRFGLSEITLQFEENWTDYVDQKESELTIGALHLRNALVSLFNEAV